MEHASSWSGGASINTVSISSVHAPPLQALESPQKLKSCCTLFVAWNGLKIDSNSTLLNGSAPLFTPNKSVKVTTPNSQIFWKVNDIIHLTFLPLGTPKKKLQSKISMWPNPLKFNLDTCESFFLAKALSTAHACISVNCRPLVRWRLIEVPGP